MSTPLRIGWALAFSVLIGAPTGASAAETRRGFSFCASPFPPSCVDADSAYDSSARLKNCQDEISRYVASVLTYRACMQTETERAILETNTVVDRFKCGMAAKHRCP